MNWPFKVHKLEPSVILVCETRRGMQRADSTEAENTVRITGGTKRGAKIKMSVRKAALMSA